ncbi:MAG: hypothetical protein IPI05_05005 [Flavobacteriales bacterium]|nr:hypothetical protein [Flavobacteriales bacterium]
MIAAKAVAFGEGRWTPRLRCTANGSRPMRQPWPNALMSKSYDVVSGGTDNRSVLVDMRSKDLTGKEAEAILGAVDITANKNTGTLRHAKPFRHQRHPHQRPGANHCAAYEEADCMQIAELMDSAFRERGDQAQRWTGYASTGERDGYG